MNNTILKTLTPAEVRTLLTPETNNLHELLKLTFLDLVRRNVLRITERAHPAGVESYVSIGTAFYTRGTGMLPHEEVLLQMFVKAPTMEVYMKSYLKAVKGTLRYNAGKYRKLIFAGGRLQPYFKTGFFYNLFGARVLNAEGVQVQKELRRDLEIQNYHLEEYRQKQDEPGMKKLFEPLGGNAFLLPSFSVGMYGLAAGVAIWEMTDHPLRKPAEAANTGDAGGCSSYSTDWGNSFDSGCSTHGHGGDSGCGGDGGGGDSGCGGSGCGGGCGGGCS